MFNLLLQFTFESFLEIFQKEGPHKILFNTDNARRVLSDIRTALTAYYFFCEEIPPLDDNKEAIKSNFDKSLIREVDHKFLKSTFLNRLNTQDRLYPKLNHLCFTPRIYNDKKFGELIEDVNFFKKYQTDLINNAFFYVGLECHQKYHFTQIESLILDNNNYYVKLKNGVVRELMGKTRDGDFNQLYQQNDNIMSSVTLDHVQPISKTIEVAYSAYYGTKKPRFRKIGNRCNGTWKP